MATLVVPGPDRRPWPTLGPQICDFLEERAVYGPGSVQGRPYVVTPEFRAWLYRTYEVYPKRAGVMKGRRRFKRAGLSIRKGLAKSEKLALICYVELHPEAPVRCDGFDADGEPVGRPVVSPYIPILSVTEGQVERQSFGVLSYIIGEGPDADLFDVSLERIIRLDEWGRGDGQCQPVATNPNAVDGDRTTMNAFDEPHRLYLPRQREAERVMDANLPKRPLEDPWSCYVGTAGQLGQGSVAEDLHFEAQHIAEGKIKDPKLFYLARWAGPGHDMKTKAGRIGAVAEATGAEGEYGPGQFADIADQWDKPKTDKSYLERVWLNRWGSSESQAFDVDRRTGLAVPTAIPDGAFVAAGFDGARFKDSTGIVLTDIRTGRQQAWAVWERPLDATEWEVPEDEVTDAWAQIRERFDLWQAYCDPPHWTETLGSWAAVWPGQFVEWWTHRKTPVAFAIDAYREAMASGAIRFVERDGSVVDDAFKTHIGNAGRKPVQVYVQDDEDADQNGRQLFVLQKLHPDRKFDLAMAGVLSWRARLDALTKGAKPRPKHEFVLPARLR